MSTINVNVQNNLSGNGNSSQPPKGSKDWRKSLIGIGLPALITAIAGGLMWYLTSSPTTSSECETKKILHSAISFIDDTKNSKKLEPDDVIVIDAFKYQFETYLHHENLCTDIELQKNIDREIKKLKSKF